jgi:micrococcal nuclease
MKRFLFCILWVLTLSLTHAQLPLLQGRVVRVLDGDTFELLQNSTKVRCRIVEIDAPELSQPFGRQSGDSLRKLILNQCVTCRPIAYDLYHRWLVKVSHLNGHPIALDSILVEKGLVWSVKGWNLKGYEANADPLQANARWYNRGLWACPSPVPPWIWRHLNTTNRRKINTCL